MDMEYGVMEIWIQIYGMDLTGVIEIPLCIPCVIPPLWLLATVPPRGKGIRPGGRRMRQKVDAGEARGKRRS